MTREHVLTVRKEDFDFQSFRVGGHGGQHRDKTSAGCRAIHRETGLRAESSESRSWTQNRKIAWLRVVNSVEFRHWLQDKTRYTVSIEEQVAATMIDANLLIEFRDEDGSWYELSRT